MEFVAFIGGDKENWGQITGLIKRLEAEKFVLLKNKQAEGFPDIENVSIIDVDSKKPLIELRDEIMTILKKEIPGSFEVALSLASGNGKEHMALLSALLNLPVGVKLSVFTKNGVEFLS